MGAYSPAPVINKLVEKKIISQIVKPTFEALKKKKANYNGFLYVGLMIKNNKPYLIEYNIRMGDPECQVILPRLKTDLASLILKSVKNKLNSAKITWKNKKSMTIVLCSKGYPGNYKKNLIIDKIKKISLKRNEFIYHAGTKFINNKFISIGGRVLNVTVVGKSYAKIRKKIISLLDKLNWKHGFFRKDIGWKVIKKNANY